MLVSFLMFQNIGYAAICTKIVLPDLIEDIRFSFKLHLYEKTFIDSDFVFNHNFKISK
jgi:hypothetical protein